MNPVTWMRYRVQRWMIARRPKNATFGHSVRREFGGWAVRPGRGWRRVRHLTPPLYYTRTIPAADEPRAMDWAMDKLLVP